MTAAPHTTALTVGQLAGKFGVTVRTLHHYDATGCSLRARAARRVPALRGGRPLPAASVVMYRRLGFRLEVIAPCSTRGKLRGAPAPAARRGPEPAGQARELVFAHRPSTGEGATGETDGQEQQGLRGEGYPTSTRPRRAAVGRHRDVEAVPAPRRRLLQGRLHRDQGRGGGGLGLAPRRDAGGARRRSTGAMEAAEPHRQHIEDRCYDLYRGFHRGLADMCLADPRFTEGLRGPAGGARPVRTGRHPRRRRSARRGVDGDFPGVPATPGTPGSAGAQTR